MSIHADDCLQLGLLFFSLQVVVNEDRVYYLTANHSTWHVNQVSCRPIFSSYIKCSRRHVRLGLRSSWYQAVFLLPTR